MKTLLIALLAWFGIALATPEAQAHDRKYRHRHYNHGHKYHHHYPRYYSYRPRVRYYTPTRYYYTGYPYRYCYPRSYYHRRPGFSISFGF